MIYKLIILLWLMLIGYWLYCARRTKRTSYEQKTFVSGVVPRGILIIIIIVLWSVPFFTKQIFLPNSTIQIVGLILCLIGIGLAIWSRRILSSNWSARIEIKEQHELITSGPYNMIRHPIYSGAILALLGSVLAYGQLNILILFILVTAGMISRAKTEERLMSKEFSDKYAVYKNRTKMLIPWLI